ncbi:MAG: universal stress protein [Ignavibacteria bacterium]|nr:universal stress protein [Ignavibacteria bacterium]MBT8384032.1 universal stress protein [Ignavibacteria bacterium]MBT8392259.1 universal stress protein [Ignavibacteria bacterium]NNJ52502.1 universal stress protein [Ignavibacteriaceae bacterium]NNL21790.1 universal stress protein [Ignavibacteriaceae bacterium]
MIKLNKILFPTDFSRCADQALEHAVFLAEKYDAEIHVLHAVTLFNDQAGVVNDEFEETEEMIKKLEDIAEIQLNKVTDAHENDDIKIIKAQTRGISAAPAILDYASENLIDLIVIGTHGRRGLGHFFLGSVAEEIVRMSECPVFTIREAEKPTHPKAKENILVPVDFSEHSRNALANAKEIAKSYQAKIHLLHIIEETIHPAYSLSGKSSIFDIVPNIKEDCEKRLSKMISETIGDEVKTEIKIVSGQAANEIINYAKTNTMDLIVIATHGLTGLEHLLLGSTTEKVVRMASCPVFTVKSFGKSLI